MKRAIAVTSLVLGLISANVWAGSNDPLFINMTSDDGHRASMALSFGGKQHDLGHGLTVFLNDKGVLVGSKAHADKFPEQQKMLADIIAKGGTVIVCPMCMKHYGVKEADLLSGLKIGNPALTGAALFKDNTKTLTW